MDRRKFVASIAAMGGAAYAPVSMGAVTFPGPLDTDSFMAAMREGAVFANRVIKVDKTLRFETGVTYPGGAFNCEFLCDPDLEFMIFVEKDAETARICHSNFRYWADGILPIRREA